MRLFLISLGVALWAAGAQAATVPEVITSFQKITVTFSERAAECAISDEKMYQSHLFNRLGEMGIKEDGGSIIQAHINVSGAPAGTSSCIIHTLLRFDTTLNAKNILTDQPAVRQAIDRLGVFPVTLWSGGALSTKQYYLPASERKIDRAAKGVLEQIDFILESFKKQRQK